MKKKILTIASVCLILALATLPLSCAKPTPTGGVLRIATPWGPMALGYPATLVRTNNLTYVACCIETILRFDETGAPVPGLATDWDVDADTKTITLTLRKGVKFHDGTDFNAEACKWNLDKYRLSERVELKKVERVDVLDDYTVRLYLSEFDNLVISHLAVQPGLIISPTAYEKHGQEWCENNPVGTGPFKFVSLEHDVGIKFERFDDYWQEGKPYLDGIEWVAIADPMVASAAFQAGEVDILTRLTPKDAKDLEATGKYNIGKTAASGLPAIAGDGEHPNSIFADIRVRQAVEYAIDKQALCDTFGYGYWTPVNQPARPGGWAYNPNVVGYPYNPKKARELLAEAGYPDGLKTTIFCPSEPSNVDQMTAVQGYLAEVGIDAGLEVYDMGRYFNVAVGGGWEDGIAVFPMGLTVPDELTMLSRLFAPGSALFCSSLRPAEYQDILVQAVKAPDFETKKALTHDLQRLGTDKYAMAIWLYASSGGIGRYPYVHDDGLMEITSIQWTPADAWVER